jgi:replicative DNA helicase/predicted transcriptional regulator
MKKTSIKEEKKEFLNSPEHEKNLLFSLMTEKEFRDKVIDDLTPDHFTPGELSTIFKAIKKIHNENGTPEIPTIIAELKSMEMNISTLLDVSDHFNIDHQYQYMKVCELYEKRLLNNTILKYTQALETDKNINDLVSGLESDIQLIQQKQRNRDVKSFEFITADKLQALELPPLKKIIDDVLTEGYAILAGPPKSGKSFLALNMALAVAQNGIFASKFKANKADVYYFALEDSYRRLQSRIRNIQQDQSFPNNLHIAIKKSFEFNEFIKRLDIELANNSQVKFVIIDTLFKATSGTSKKSSNIYENEYDIGSTLQDIALKHNACILVLHHTRKMSDPENVFNEISGSTGTTAAADVVLMLRRRAEHTNLHVSGRDVELNEFAMEFDTTTGLWNCKGKSEIVESSKQQRDILELLQTSGSFTAKQISEATDIPYKNIHRVIKSLYDKGVKKYPNTNKYYYDTNINNNINNKI